MALPLLLIQLGNSTVVFVPTVAALEAAYHPQIDSEAIYETRINRDGSYAPTITREADER